MNGNGKPPAAPATEEDMRDALQRAYLAGIAKGHKEMFGLVAIALLTMGAVAIVGLLG